MKRLLAIAALVAALWGLVPMPVRAAELPDELVGLWCFDKNKMWALAGKGLSLEPYTRLGWADGKTRNEIPRRACANRGGLTIGSDGTIATIDSRPCKLDVERLGPHFYRATETCPDEEPEHYELEIVPQFASPLESDWSDEDGSVETLIIRHPPQG